MNSRKLLAFILVFSLATQPGGVRFSYAEDTKATEVKIEEKTEASNELAIELDETELDEYLFDPGSREQKLEEAATVAAEETAETSKISGALAGAIAAGVAAVTAAVGAAGLMIYNGVSNKDEIAKLWTSEEDSFFSRLGKTISILFKGANKVPGEQEEAPVVKENTEPLGEEPTQSDEKTQPTGIDSVDKSLCDEGKLDKEYCDKLEEKLKAKVPTEAPVEETTPVVEEKPCKYGENEETLTCDAELKQEISNLKDYQQKEAERLAKEEAERKAKEEAARLAKEEAERKAKEEAARLAKEEAERKAKEEAARLAKEESERKAKEETERLAKEEAERKAKEEAARLAKEEAERKAKEEAARLAKEKALLLENNKTVLRNGVNKFQSRIEALKEEHKGSLQDELNAVKNTIETATTVEALEGVEGQLTALEVKVAEAEAINVAADKVDGVVSELNKAVEEAKAEEHNTKIRLNLQEQRTRVKKLVQDKMKLKRQVDSVQLQINALKEEDRGEVQEELNKIKNVIEKATSVEGLEGQLSSLQMKVEDVDSKAKEEAERLEKEEAERKAKEESEVKKQETGEIGQDEKPVDNAENNDEQQDTNEGSNSREKNPTTIFVETPEEAFKNALAVKAAKGLVSEKNSASKTLNKLEKTCGLDTVGLKSELNALALETLTTDEEFAQAEKKLNSIINRVNTLSGECSDIKSKKGYIEKNWQAAVSILDSSDASLRNAWGTLNLQRATEGNLKELAEEYTTIAGRVKAIINSNNKISKLTGEISKAIEDKKDAADFGMAHYRGKLKAIDKMERREDSLGQIIDELDLLYDKLQKNYSKKDIKAVNKALDEFDNSELVKYFESEECSARDNEDRYEPYEKLVKPLIAKKNEIIAAAKKNHSLNGVVEKLEELQANERSVVQKIRSLNRNTKAANDAIKQYEGEAWFNKAYFEEWLQGATKDKIATESDLELRANNVAAILNDLETNFSKKEIKAVNKALDEFDNSAIVKGACTQSRLFGWKKENKLTSEQCNTLKDKFVAERDRLVEEAKSSHSVVGLAQKLKNLYDNTDEYINDVAKLNADASEIEEIINEAGKFGLIDTEYFNNKLEENKDYSLDDLKSQRKAMGEFLSSLKTNFSEKNLNTLNSLDSEINKIISAFGEYKASYVSQYKEKYAAKCEELKEMHDAGKAVAELEKYKDDLQTKLDKVKTFCKNNPAKCGKQEKGE